MRYSAVTIDTNIVTNNGYNLEGGLLARLFQFNGGSTTFVIPEIVIREINKHLIDQAKETRSRLDQVVSKYAFHGLLGSEQITKIREIGAQSLEPRAAARQRIHSFLQNTGGSIIKCEETNIKDLVKLYFDAQAPFELAGNKKNEFPDAIALLSLEAWAKKEDKKILAISKDVGWHNFAKNSVWIDVEPDLAKALELLQEHADTARQLISELIGSAVRGDRPEITETIRDFLRQEISSSSYYAEANAAHRVETDYVEGFFEEFEFRDIGSSEFDIDIVEMGENKIVASIKIDVKAKFTADFSFYMYDSIDKDEIGMGSSDAQTEEEFELSVLLTFTGDFSNLSEVELSDVEAVDMIDTIDFGYVEIDYGEPDEWEPDDLPDEPETESKENAPF